MKRTKGYRVFSVFNYAALAVAGAMCVMPFAHLLAMSFSSSEYVSAGAVRFWPMGFTLSSYEFITKSGKFVQAFFVSIKRILIGVPLNLLIMTLCAYPLSHNSRVMPGRNALMGFFLFTMLFGGGMIPAYLVVSRLKLLNSIWALILPGVVPVYNIILLMNFLRGLPQELEDAAMIDGAGPMATLAYVILPVSKPALAMVTLFCLVSHWNAWFDGLIYMNNSANYPLQTYLQRLVMNPEEMIREARGDYKRLLSMMNARTGRAAQLFLGMLPILCVYPWLQKYFTAGLVMGSVKG